MATNRRIKEKQRKRKEHEERKDQRFCKYYLVDFPAHLKQHKRDTDKQ